jgi:hypothetical protein
VVSLSELIGIEFSSLFGRRYVGDLLQVSGGSLRYGRDVSIPNTNPARQRALDRLHQYRIRIDRDPLPPAFWVEQMDFEVQLRGEGRGVSAASDVTDYVTLRYLRSLAKSLRVMF